MIQILAQFKSDFGQLSIAKKQEKLVKILGTIKDKAPSYNTMYNHIMLMKRDPDESVLDEYYGILADKFEQVQERSNVRQQVDIELSSLETKEHDRVQDSDKEDADVLLNQL